VETLVNASISAPLFMRRTAALALLYFAAMWRGVKPFCVREKEQNKI
jgi:hypothetical protein